jgi:hypothetical protein
MLIIDKNTKYFPGTFQKPKLDAILITGSRKVDLENLSQCFNFDFLIIDASVPSWKRKQVISESERLGIQVYDTNSDGAFVIEL